jgi:membrane-associated phospholipid phosphatase
VLPWTRAALDLIGANTTNPPRAARTLALVHTAMADAIVAVHDARLAWRRPLPAAAVPGLVPVVTGETGRFGFPSEPAAVAAAASAVLAELYPAELGSLVALAEEAATSQLWAGLAYRSDVEAGMRLGRAIGERAIARARGDGSDAVWDSERPSGAGVWQPTPPAYVESPLEPLAGSWRPWVIGDVVAARPAEPPDWGSPAWQAELAAVQDAVARRTPEQEAAAHFWAGGPGTVTPAGLWIEIAIDLILRDGLESAHAARVLALTSVATADAFVCCWDAKYAYWTARPITADPHLNVLFPTPPFPSFTSGHSTISAAAAAVLGHLFPADAADLAAQAEEAKNSRLWAGIHFPIDNEVGAAMGGMVGRTVADVARHDGAE